jgi:membrane fusion protein, heavy metal efflux system
MSHLVTRGLARGQFAATVTLASLVFLTGCTPNTPSTQSPDQQSTPPQSQTSPADPTAANSGGRPHAAQATTVSLVADNPEATIVEFPKASWEVASIKIGPATLAPLSRSIELTGKISLNEDRVAHIFPLVEGRVDEVKIRLGEKVTKDQTLVVVQSREVGQAMLQLFQDRMQHEFAITKDRWMQTVAENTESLIQMIRQGAPIEEIESQLTNRPIGEYREKLMSAYIASYKAKRHLERLSPLSQGGAITGKQMLEAETENDAARATLQSLVEQIQQDVRQARIVSSQSIKEFQTRVAVDETNLKILGFDDAAIAKVDPKLQGEAISHYPILAPFDGTIISKDVVLLERVGPESQILGIADLSTVWVAADIYEEHFPLLKQLGDNTITVHSDAWPEKTFTAKVFYAGDLVNDSTRTLSLRAIAANDENLLKPGMFVKIRLQFPVNGDVMQVPESAIQEHEGKRFVFIHLGEEQFQRRDIVVGIRSGGVAEIVSGLKPGDSVVTSGGFALKTRMLAELLGE